MRDLILKNMVFSEFKKRNGTRVPFRVEKIKNAIFAAAKVVAQKEGKEAELETAEELAVQVVEYLDNPDTYYYVRKDGQGERIPEIEDVQDVVEIVLSDAGHSKTVAEYKRFRKGREVAREKIQVRTGAEETGDVTDRSLLIVESITDNVTKPWNRSKITEQLVTEVGMLVEDANSVAKAVENKIIEGDFEMVSTALVREMVNNELSDRGYHQQLKDLSIYATPRDFIDQLMYNKSEENSNINSIRDWSKTPKTI